MKNLLIMTPGPTGMHEEVLNAFVNCGFELFPKSHYSNTVTAVNLPGGISFKTLFDELKTEGVLIGGGFGFLKNKIGN